MKWGFVNLSPFRPFHLNYKTSDLVTLNIDLWYFRAEEGLIHKSWYYISLFVKGILSGKNCEDQDGILVIQCKMCKIRYICALTHFLRSICLNAILASPAFCTLDLSKSLPTPGARARRGGAFGGPRSGQRAAVALSVLLVWPEQPSRWCKVTGTDVTYRFRHTSIPPVTGSGWLTCPCSGPVPPLQDNTAMLEWTSPSAVLLPGMALPQLITLKWCT